MITSRWRLASLWFAQLALVLAQNCLAVFLLSQWFGPAVHAHDTLRQICVLLAWWLLPGLVLAPFLGALCNAASRQRVLKLALLAGSAAAAAGLLELISWPLASTLLAVIFGLATTARQAMLPTAGQDCGWSPSRVNSLFEAGTAGAVVGGWLLADAFAETVLGPYPGPAVLATGLYLMAFVLSLPVHFPGDAYRSTTLVQALVGFFRDAIRIWKLRATRRCLKGLVIVRVILVAFLGLLLLWAETLGHLQVALLCLVAGVAGGALLVGCQKHPRRSLAFVALGATGLAVCLVVTAFTSPTSPVLCCVVGAMFGLVNVPLLMTYQENLPAESRGNGMAFWLFVNHLMMLATGAIVLTLNPAWVRSYAPVVLPLGGAFLAGLSWWLLLREVLEQFAELMLVPFYSIRGTGPGLTSFPRRGPVLVVANHSSWLDPMWLAKVLPRRIIALMTSQFFDLPGMRWLMAHVAHAIRVEAASFRRDVPELKEAIAALDRGEVVVVFPEGMLRRRESQPIKLFGQGVWHILEQRPMTPVVVCWIEGGWGSFCSYHNGPPTKNKRMDIRRKIRIGAAAPQIVPGEILAEHLMTRSFLMHECLQARKHLGLEPMTLEKSDEGGSEPPMEADERPAIDK